MKTLLLLPLLAGLASAESKPAPAWLEKTVIPGESVIRTVGRSSPQKTEKDAKDEALAEATAQFVKYCGVRVEAFARSLEIYSKDQGKEYARSGVEAQNLIRARAFVSRAVPEEWHVAKEGRKYVASVLLRVPKEEMDRILNEKDVKLSLDIVLYYEDDKGHMKPMSEGTVLKSGEGYALYLKASDQAFIYVYQVDGAGKSFRLFPNKAFRTAENPVSSAADLWIPNEKDLVTLDDTTGKERLFIFASPTKLPDFEGDAGAELAAKDLEGAKGITKMGVAGLKKKVSETSVTPPQKRDVVEVKKKLQADGAFVYETWFWHR
jgi:hypothetical protein